MAKIEFYKDDTGRSEVLELFKQFEEQSKTDSGMARIYALILNGLEFLERHGMPAINTMVELHHEDNSPYSVKLIKDLVRHKDLYEFRINWKEAGAFRAIFFQFDYKDDKVIFITNAVLKDGTYSKEFDKYAKLSETIQRVITNDPKVYFDKNGDDPNE
jgi:hypothetical protein